MSLFLQIFNIVISPFIWAFEKFESIKFDNVPAYVILLALYVMGILLANLMPLAQLVSRVDDFSGGSSSSSSSSSFDKTYIAPQNAEKYSYRR